MIKIKFQWLKHIYFFTLFTIIFFIPTTKADLIIPNLFDYFSFFHFLYIIPVILIEATIVYFVLRLKFFNYKIKYWKSLFMFLCANSLTTIIGLLYPLINRSFYHSYISLVLMFTITSLLETLVILLFLQKKVDKPLKISFILSFFINIFSYVFLIIITGTQFY